MELLSFCKRLLKNNFSVKKQNDLVAFFSFTHLKNFKIKKEIKKEFIPMIYSKAGGKNKSTQTSNDGVLEEFTLENYKFIIVGGTKLRIPKCQPIKLQFSKRRAAQL